MKKKKMKTVLIDISGNWRVEVITMKMLIGILIQCYIKVEKITKNILTVEQKYYKLWFQFSVIKKYRKNYFYSSLLLFF